MSYFDDFFDEPEYKDERDVYNRTSITGYTVDKNKLTQDSEEHFKQKVESTAIEYNMTQTQRQILIDNVKNIPLREYKNIIGYVAGYYVLIFKNDKYIIQKEKFEEIKKYVNKELSESDIIRYARLWQQIILNK